MKSAKEMSIPIELVESLESIDQLMVYLKVIKKLLQGKAVTSKQGVKNKLKHYILGYLLTEKVAICKKCGSPMILEHTTEGGFKPSEGRVCEEFVTHGNKDSKYRYFHCPKCRWSFCTDE